MLSFSITLPTWAKSRPMKWFSSKYHCKISSNKSFEWQTDYFGWTNLFCFELDLIPTGSDHARVGLSVTVLGFMISAMIYDSRHWDYETDAWKISQKREKHDG